MYVCMYIHISTYIYMCSHTCLCVCASVRCWALLPPPGAIVPAMLAVAGEAGVPPPFCQHFAFYWLGMNLFFPNKALP